MALLAEEGELRTRPVQTSAAMTSFPEIIFCPLTLREGWAQPGGT